MAGEDVTGGVGQPAGTESSLSNWAGDYVTDMLGRGWALADQPYQSYNGPLTSGPSGLQQDAFSGIAGLALPNEYGSAGDMASDIYDNAGNLITAQWNNQWADQYMSPYIEQALNPQLEEIRRNSDIQRMLDNSRLTKAGAYGGGRQAIMNSELNDNTARLMNETVGKGYQDAYDSAGRMFTSDKQRKLEADKAGLGYGLDAIRQIAGIGDQKLQGQRDIYGDQLRAGDIQRGITQEGIAADIAQFENERDYPYRQVKFMQSLLDGLPLSAQNSTYTQPDFLSALTGGTGGILSILDSIFGGNSPNSASTNAAGGFYGTGV